MLAGVRMFELPGHAGGKGRNQVNPESSAKPGIAIALWRDQHVQTEWDDLILWCPCTYGSFPK